MTNKLHTMLGSMEDKVHQAKSQGTAHNVDRSLLRLSHKFSPGSQTPLNRKLPLRFVASNMTGHALWQTFANHAEQGDADLGSIPDPKSAEDKYDDLCADFTEVSKSILEVKGKIQQLTEEVATQTDLAESSKGKKGQVQMSRSDIMSEANEKLAELKAQLTKLDMEKTQIMDKMGECEK